MEDTLNIRHYIQYLIITRRENSLSMMDKMAGPIVRFHTVSSEHIFSSGS